MRCGVLCDASGNILRKWALINDLCSIVPEPGQTVIEWEIDHGEQHPPGLDKETLTRDALEEQHRIRTLQTQEDVTAHGHLRGHSLAVRSQGSDK